jgi:tetratricopeptide (TPR) repeat protein
LLAALALVALVVAAYAPVRRGNFVSDDNTHLLENQRLKKAEGLWRIWFGHPEEQGVYYPLTFTTFWIEHQLWGVKPLGYHVVNVLLHAANALLLWLVLRRLAVPGAWLAAAIFAIHPANVESVAFVTERRNVLSTLFYLLAILAYLRFAGDDAANERPPRRWLYYGLSCAAFLAALLSKTVTVTLPVVLVLLIWWQHRRLTARDVLRVVPFLVLGAAMACVTIWFESTLVEIGREQWGAELSLPQRILIAGQAFWFYVGRVVWPAGLSFIYPRWAIDAANWVQYLYPAAAVVLLPALWLLRRRVGIGPLLAVLCFAVTLGPVLGFINFYYMAYSLVADRFLYVPSMAIVAAIVALAAGGLERWKPTGRTVARVAGAVFVVALSVLTYQRARVFENSETLYRDVVAKYPENVWGNEYLGNTLFHAGEIAEAIPYLETAFRLQPDMPALSTLLANGYAQVGRTADALRVYEKAVEVMPDDAVTHYNYGLTLQRAGRPADAVDELILGAQLDPSFRDIRTALLATIKPAVDSHMRTGRINEAIGALNTILDRLPDFAEGHAMLAHLLLAARRFDEACQHCAEALRMMPDDWRTRLRYATALAALHRAPDAIAQYRACLQTVPDNVEALAGLAWTLATDSDSQHRSGSKALALAQRACALSGNQHPYALDALAAACAESGDFAQAVEIAQRALAVARQHKLDAMAQAIEARVALYSAGQVYRETATTTAPAP